jgi:hypothetical protein
VLWNADFPERPFCSERCRLIDLGAWLSGDRAIPGEPIEDPALLGSGPAAAADSGDGEGGRDAGSRGDGGRVARGRDAPPRGR